MPPKRSQRTAATSRTSKRRTSKAQSDRARKSKRIRRTDEQRLLDLEQELTELKAKIEAGKSFSAEAVRKDRARLQLSAADYAALVGVSMLTVYNWEKGRSQARAKQVTQWRAVCELSLEEAWEQLGYEVD
ncbi:MAG: helix-turn-helix domain-containing protein [Planctomycetota bacterium]